MRTHDSEPSVLRRLPRIGARPAALLLTSLLVAGAWLGVGAQEMANLPQVPSTPSLRPYWHVFAAYTIAIVLIGGWAISIARRLRDVEGRLSDQGE